MMPARIAPQNSTGKSTVSSMIIATRSSRCSPSRASIGPTRAQAVGQFAVSERRVGSMNAIFAAAPFRDIAVDHVDGGIVALRAHSLSFPALVRQYRRQRPRNNRGQIGED